ncbi:MAG: alanyl-tRNA editing protein [Lachnospiraceae bacterium]|nr:alanyl-tRNA editing protein [Lachnospiraceae bacterium]
MGSTVKGEIDFDHRFLKMQMHSAEHVFSGLVHSRFGYNNVGFHLSDNSATMDYDGKFSYEEALELERKVNEIIVAGKKISAVYPSKEELAALSYRSKKELSGPVRIVTVEDTDICACCAPHVRNTSEIGIFKIISWENYKSGVRINYLAGFRAVEDYERKLSDLREISRTLSFKQGDELNGVIKLSNDLSDLKYKDVEIRNKYINLKIESEKIESENGLIVLSSDFSSHIKYACDALKRFYAGSRAVLCGDDEAGYRFYVESDTKDLSLMFNALKEKYDVKGGGKKNAIQGTILAKSSDFRTFL